MKRTIVVLILLGMLVGCGPLEAPTDEDLNLSGDVSSIMCG